MKYFSKIFMAGLLLLQVHCATVAPSQSYKKNKTTLTAVCDAILEDSGLQKTTNKKEYNQCLQNQLASFQEKQGLNLIASGIYSYLAIIFSAAILSFIITSEPAD